MNFNLYVQWTKQKWIMDYRVIGSTWTELWPCVVVVQSPSRVRLFPAPWTAAHQASLSLSISWGLLKVTSIALVMSSSHLIHWLPLFLLPSVFPSNRDFSSELAVLTRWPKYWGSSFSFSPSNEYSGLISLKTDWFYLLVVQGTLRSLF